MRAIIPVAGLGTRLLPFTKVIPKAMLPVANKPCVQWIVEELVRNGIKEIIFVISHGQEMLREYFTEKNWYEKKLAHEGKQENIQELKKIRELANYHFVEQNEQLGDGHAILQAKRMLHKDEAFLVIFGDCLYEDDESIQKLIEVSHNGKYCTVAIQNIDPNKTHLYGIVETSSKTPTQVERMVEKPSMKITLSNKALIGRYLLTPTIWMHLEKKRNNSGEIRLIDALNSLLQVDQIRAVSLNGTWLDTGTLEGLHKAGKYLFQKRTRF